MPTEEILEFFQALGFEETDIEDDLTALAVELTPDGYALISDEEGLMPQSLRQRLIFAYYTAAGAYQWSSGFKNAYVFQKVWSKAATPDQKCAAVRRRAAEQEDE